MVFKGGTKRSKYEKWRYGKNSLEVVNSFRYLGYEFNFNLSNKRHIDSVCLRCKIAACAINKFVYATRTLPLNLALLLGQSLVQSTLSYGVEIFSMANTMKCSSVLTRFYKNCLMLPASAPNSGTELIVGRRGFAVSATRRAFKFWLRLLAASEGSLLNDAYISELQMCGNGKECWLRNWKQRLDELGMSNVWLKSAKFETEGNTWLKQVTQRAIDADFSEQLVSMGKLKSLSHLKERVITPTGLNEIIQINDQKRRRLVAQAFLNCPGSMCFRSGRFMYCSECSSPIPSKNIFIHNVFECKSVVRSTEVQRFMAHNDHFPTDIKMLKLLDRPNLII